MGSLIRGMLHLEERPTSQRIWIVTSGVHSHACVSECVAPQEKELIWLKKTVLLTFKLSCLLSHTHTHAHIQTKSTGTHIVGFGVVISL